MTRANGIGGFVLCAATLGAGFGAPDAATRRALASDLHDRYLEVCTPPLNHEDAVLDESTDLYRSAASRATAATAAIDLAIGLRRIHLGYRDGHFGSAYASRAGEIESLARKHAETDQVTSSEIRALKQVRAALYADTVVGLRAYVADAPSRSVLSAYEDRESVLDGVLLSLSSPQPMREAERRAVCQVLAELG